MESYTHSPTEQERKLTDGLDYYKPTMSQLEFEQLPDVEVTFTFKNRAGEALGEFVDIATLQARLDRLQKKGFTTSELDYLATIVTSTNERVFSDTYLQYLATHQLPPANVRKNNTTGEIESTPKGPAPLVTFWETIILSEINELYSEGYMRKYGLNPDDVYAEGDRRLSEKIAFFQQNPDIKFADFGTRRRFSLRWHDHVVERLAKECPENFVGTSNVALAQKYGVKPIGTFAHELPMIYAGMADAQGQDIAASQNKLFDDWYARYGDDMSIMLSDTFGTQFFFDSITSERAAKFKGTRQDSGDPITYGENTVAFYEQNGIDPSTKTVVFSDNLNTEKVQRIHNAFKGVIGHLFGIGTFFTNDMGIKAGNNVMKATHIQLPNGQEADLVKLSDDTGKHTGPAGKVALYETVFVKQLVKGAA